MYLPFFLLASIIFKFINIGFTNCISHDGIYYLNFAKSFLEGNYKEYINNEFIPFFYPFLVVATNFIVHDLEMSGQVVSAIAGTGMIVIMYIIGKNFFDYRIGVLMGLMTLISPLFNRSSSKVMTDMLYAFLYTWAIYNGWRMSQDPKVKFIFLFSILAALSYYTRPEGLGLIIVIGFWLIYTILSSQDNLNIKRVLSLFVSVTLFSVLIFPQLYIIHEKTGGWTFSAKTSYMIRKIPGIKQSSREIKEERDIYIKEGGFGGILSKYPHLLIKKTIVNICKYFLDIPKVMGFILMIPFIIGIGYRKRIPYKKKEELFCLFIIIFNIIIFSLFKEKMRHLISVLPFLYIWCSIGFLELYFFLQNKNIFSLKKEKVIALSMSLIIVGILPQTFRPVFKNGYIFYWGPEKIAGHWIRRNIPSQKSFMSWRSDEVLFYAGINKHLSVPKDGFYSVIMRLARNLKINYLVMNNNPHFKSIKSKGADFFRNIDNKALSLIYRLKLPHSKSEILIYKFNFS